MQYALQEMMQDLVGHRAERAARCSARSRRSGRCASARSRVGVGGHREYNPGWHAALDLHNLLTVSEAITRSAIERRESRGGHFRDDYPDKDPACATFNIIVRKRPRRRDGGLARADSGDAGRAEAHHRGDEVEAAGGGM